MQTNLQGKAVLVTDAAGNFGKSTALAFAREGANLVLAAPGSQHLLDQTDHEAAALGARVVTGVWDVADPAQVRALVQQGLQEFGHLDVVVNNARFALAASSLDELPFELWSRKIQVDLTGALVVCREVLPGMIRQRWGRVISYIGLAGFQGTDAPASAAELGIVGLMRGVAREYGKHNITANCIGPGGIREAEDLGLSAAPPNPRDPLPRWGEPAEVAFLAVCLASEDAGYVTGQCLLANGGKYFL